jgi:hypothetical protein
MLEETQTEHAVVDTSNILPEAYDTKDLNEESLKLLGQIITENDEEKTKDLTYLFNVNQNKKTMVRMDKLSGLQDGLVDQFVKRIQERPDEISNKELMDGLRIVQDIIERGQRQISETEAPQPLIQINQQNNSLNVGDGTTELNRESRERVKNAVLGFLSEISTRAPANTDSEIPEEEEP